ncbi:hypothetical protein AB0M39_27980 [Streptomyces sp. NPDC051907]|uniref:hypothetical protein n=1 Tax=Streptomyces sp. NPDC051907 TaxID=3155284 RepID=UPI00342B4165
MSGYAFTGNTSHKAEGTHIDHDWRFAELVARSCLQPDLALRYALEPLTVLAEFGIVAGPDTVIPALPTDVQQEMTIISLTSLKTHSSTQSFTCTLCGSSPGPDHTEAAAVGLRPRVESAR